MDRAGDALGRHLSDGGGATQSTHSDSARRSAHNSPHAHSSSPQRRSRRAQSLPSSPQQRAGHPVDPRGYGVQSVVHPAGRGHSHAPVLTPVAARAAGRGDAEGGAGGGVVGGGAQRSPQQTGWREALAELSGGEADTFSSDDEGGGRDSVTVSDWTSDSGSDLEAEDAASLEDEALIDTQTVGQRARVAAFVLLDNVGRECERAVRTFPARQLMMIRQVGLGCRYPPRPAALSLSTHVSTVDFADSMH